MKKLILAFCLFFAALGYSQTPLKPVTWNVVYIEKSATEGEIVFTATIEKKWHIYSQRPTDVGPIPTSFTVAPNAGFELIGKVDEGQAHEEYVAAFDAKVFVFSEKAMFKQKIKLKNTNKINTICSLEFMTCNDVQCLPPTTLDFEVTIPASGTKK